MSIKTKRLLIIYTLTALIALSGYACAAARELESLRLSTRYASARAFEEAVSAVEGMSGALRKLAYVTDESLGKSLCAQACADAQAAETALSILPFDNWELEKLESWLGRAGDYAGSLCALAETRLPDEHREHLRAHGEAAADFAGQLRNMQAQLHDGNITMDTREKRLLNVEAEDTRKLSAMLLGYESGFAYSPAQEEAGGTLSEGEALNLAAKAADVEPRELREEYDYEGPEGRRCYSAGGLLIGVSSRGLEFMGRSRLVSAASVGREQAQKNAEAFLEKMGYADLALYEAGGSDYVAAFRYAPTQDGVMRPDDALSISVALDDGSVYAFDATKYSARAIELSWNTDEEAARKTLPSGVEAVSARKLIRKSPGGNYLPCWELTIGDGEARVYVDARSGRQCAVEIDE